MSEKDKVPKRKKTKRDSEVILKDMHKAVARKKHKTASKLHEELVNELHGKVPQKNNSQSQESGGG